MNEADLKSTSAQVNQPSTVSPNGSTSDPTQNSANGGVTSSDGGLRPAATDGPQERPPEVLAPPANKVNGSPAAHAVSSTIPQTNGAWPDPFPIHGELPPVQPFREELLPASFRPQVRDIAERMQVPMDYPAAVTVVALAGAVNRRAKIQPKELDSGWIVVPNLWGDIIAPPGYLKSPVMQAACRPLNRIQEQWRQEYKQAQAEHALAEEEHTLRHSVWKDQMKNHIKASNDDPAPERPPNLPPEPKLRRIIANDSTFEKLHEIMEENSAGVFVIRDELTGWLEGLDRSGREGERAFYLEAWSGDTGHTIDRIGRGTVHVEACCISMIGGIQPSRLRSYLVDALHDGPNNDGLFQRFQVNVWPDTNSDWEYVDRVPDAAADGRAERVYRQLVKLDPEQPLQFRFAPDAQKEFIQWLANLEAKVRGDELHPALISHLSKYRSLMPSLALLFELADRAANGSEGFDGAASVGFEKLEVTLEHTQQAIAWCGYLESHARRIYSCIITPQMAAAQELAKKLKTGRIGANGPFTCRDVYLKGWSQLTSPELVDQALALLEDAGWLRQARIEPGRDGGRPTKKYSVNPKIKDTKERDAA